MDHLWQLPTEHLRRVQGAWSVRSAPGLGRALGLFLPLAHDPAAPTPAWSLAFPGPELALTPVDDTDWTPLAAPLAPDATHFLCLLRYDHPPDRPGDNFFLKAQQALQAGRGAASAGRAELQQVLDRLLALDATRIAREVLSAASVARPAVDLRFAVRGGQDGVARPTGPERLSFAFGSCQYPAGMLDRPVAHAACRALAAHIRAQADAPPERLLLLGDQVYTDATYGLIDPVRLDDRYRMPYEDWKHRETGPLAALDQDFLWRVLMTPDDHELVDGWEPWEPGATGTRFTKGMEGYWEHQRGMKPQPVVDQQDQDRQRGWRVFMADTRTRRAYRSAETLATATLIDEDQANRLEQWLVLAGREDELKIVTSAAMLLPRSREYMDDPLYLDNWQGYPASFYRLLAFACEHEVGNLVFLSGDAHLACETTVTVTNLRTRRTVRFGSHHAPALYAPYPFANESPHNLLLPDRFCFTAACDGRTSDYECTVTGRIFPAGQDGCGLLTAVRTPEGWGTAMSVIR